MDSYVPNDKVVGTQTFKDNTSMPLDQAMGARFTQNDVSLPIFEKNLCRI